MTYGLFSQGARAWRDAKRRWRARRAAKSTPGRHCSCCAADYRFPARYLRAFHAAWQRQWSDSLIATARTIASETIPASCAIQFLVALEALEETRKAHCRFDGSEAAHGEAAENAKA